MHSISVRANLVWVQMISARKYSVRGNIVVRGNNSVRVVILVCAQ